MGSVNVSENARKGQLHFKQIFSRRRPLIVPQTVGCILHGSVRSILLLVLVEFYSFSLSFFLFFLASSYLSFFLYEPCKIQQKTKTIWEVGNYSKGGKHLEIKSNPLSLAHYREHELFYHNDAQSEFPGISHHHNKVDVSIDGRTHASIIIHELFLCHLQTASSTKAHD